jgi:hypothetical protein
MTTSADLASWLFMVANAGRMLAYLPQIYAAYKCRNGAVAVSRLTWGYFASAHLSAVYYAVAVLNDDKVALVFSGNFLACLILIALVTWKKLGHTESDKHFQSPMLKPANSTTI